MVQEDSLTEERIFAAATEVFIEKGLDGARMQDIANRACINKALLHYYFRTKEKLFVAVFDKLSDTMLKIFEPIFDREIPIEEKITRFFREHIGFLQKNPRLPLFLLGEIGKRDDLLDRFVTKINFQLIRDNLSKDKNVEIPDGVLPHLMVTVISLSIFPIIGKPILEKILGQMGIDYNEFIEERKEFSPALVNNALMQLRKDDSKK